MRKVALMLLVLVALAAIPGLAGAQNGTILPMRSQKAIPFQNRTILPMQNGTILPF